MAKILTPGRWLGLKSTSNDDGKFTIVAFDQRRDFRSMLPEGTSYEKAVQIKKEVTSAIAPPASAMLLDPDYGPGPAMNLQRGVGLLMTLEAIGWLGTDTAREIYLNAEWPLGKIKRFGAAGAKLLVFYHPESVDLAAKTEQKVFEICEECHAYDLPIFVEPMSYSLDPSVSKNSAAFAAARPEIVIETARRFSQLGCDVLKMEFPMDADFDTDRAGWRDACRALSDAVDVPWVLLSAGVDFDTFDPQVQTACEQGASGFLAGRAIWKEVAALDDTERGQYIATNVMDRMNQLCAHAESARPWQDFYQPSVVDAEWHNTYAALQA